MTLIEEWKKEIVLDDGLELKLKAKDWILLYLENHQEYKNENKPYTINELFSILVKKDEKITKRRYYQAIQELKEQNLLYEVPESKYLMLTQKKGLYLNREIETPEFWKEYRLKHKWNWIK